MAIELIIGAAAEVLAFLFGIHYVDSERSCQGPLRVARLPVNPEPAWGHQGYYQGLLQGLGMLPKLALHAVRAAISDTRLQLLRRWPYEDVAIMQRKPITPVHPLINCTGSVTLHVALSPAYSCLVPCPEPCALCPMPCALCPVPCALCPVPCALCPVPCALCPVPCALCQTWADPLHPLVDLQRQRGHSQIHYCVEVFCAAASPQNMTGSSKEGGGWGVKRG